MTTEMKHTPEPWSVNPKLRGTVQAGKFQGDVIVADCNSSDERPRAERAANATRIVACVNACGGLSDPMASMELLKQDHQRTLRAEATNAELLAALKTAVWEIHWHEEKVGLILRGMGASNIKKCEDAIANAEAAK